MPRVLILLLVLIGASGLAHADLHEAVAGLGSRSFDDKAQAIEQIARSGDPQATVILDALENRELVEDRANQRKRDVVSGSHHSHQVALFPISCSASSSLESISMAR